MKIRVAYKGPLYASPMIFVEIDYKIVFIYYWLRNGVSKKQSRTIESCQSA